MEVLEAAEALVVGRGDLEPIDGSRQGLTRRFTFSEKLCGPVSPQPGCLLHRQRDGVTAVAPARPSELPELGIRLHALAVAAGQALVAEWITYLFGEASCPHCGSNFALPERIEAEYSA